MRFAIPLIFSAVITTTIAAPEGHFRILRTDHKTAESLRQTMIKGSLPDDQLVGKIDGMISRKTITLIADFSDGISEQMHFEKEAGTIEIKEIEEVVPMGIRLDISPNVSPYGPMVDMLLSLDMMEKGKRLQYSRLSTTSASTLEGDRWHWYHHWRGGGETTLILTKFAGVPEGKGEAGLGASAVFLNYELLSVSPADLTRFGKSTPATRKKAINWLRNQAEILDATRLVCRSGERAQHEDRVHLLTDKGGEWNTWYGGSHMMLSPVIGAYGKKVDLGIEFTWQDRDEPESDPEFEFNIGATYDAGSTTIVEPTKAPKNTESSLVLLITPEVVMPETKPVVDGIPPTEEGLVLRTYVVPPGFKRILKEESKSDERAQIKDTLGEFGMKFPAGTSVHFMSRNCTLMLRHDKSGHEAFLKIRKLVEEKS